jgi:hypothetical protein
MRRLNLISSRHSATMVWPLPWPTTIPRPMLGTHVPRQADNVVGLRFLGQMIVSQSAWAGVV